MPVFSIILIGLLLYILKNTKGFKNTYKELLVLLLILEMIYSCGGMVWINGESILRRNLFFEMIVILYCIYGIVFKRVNINVRLFKFFSLFCLSLIFLIIVNYLFPYNGYIPSNIERNVWDEYVIGTATLVKFNPNKLGIVREFIRVVGVALMLLVAKSCLEKKDVYDILKSTLYYMKFYWIIGAIQFILANVFDANAIFYNIREIFTGPAQGYVFTSETTSHRGLFYPIYGLSKEPSHFCSTMYYYSVLIILFLKINRQNNISAEINYRKYLLISIVMMLLSGGLSSIYYTLMIIVLHLLLKVKEYNWNDVDNVAIKVGSALLLLSLVLFVIWELFLSSQLSYYVNRIDNVFLLVDYIVSGKIAFLYGVLPISELARMVSIIFVLNMFLERPFIGIGIGSLNAHDITVSILANFGIIGTILWGMNILCKTREYKGYDVLFCCIFFFLGGIPGQQYIRGVGHFYFPFIALCTSLYCSVFVYGKTNSKIRLEKK